MIKIFRLLSKKCILFYNFQHYFNKKNEMTEELKSEGKCLYCGKMFSQRGISKLLYSLLVRKGCFFLRNLFRKTC